MVQIFFESPCVDQSPRFPRTLEIENFPGSAVLESKDYPQAAAQLLDFEILITIPDTISLATKVCNSFALHVDDR